MCVVDSYKCCCLEFYQCFMKWNEPPAFGRSLSMRVKPNRVGFSGMSVSFGFITWYFFSGGVGSCTSSVVDRNGCSRCFHSTSSLSKYSVLHFSAILRVVVWCYGFSYVSTLPNLAYTKKVKKAKTRNNSLLFLLDGFVPDYRLARRREHA